MDRSPADTPAYIRELEEEAERWPLPLRPMHRSGEDFPEFIQRQIDDADPLPPPWSRRRCLAAAVVVSCLLWALLIFAIIGMVAVFGDKI